MHSIVTRLQLFIRRSSSVTQSCSTLKNNFLSTSSFIMSEHNNSNATPPKSGAGANSEATPNNGTKPKKYRNRKPKQNAEGRPQHQTNNRSQENSTQNYPEYLLDASSSNQNTSNKYNSPSKNYSKYKKGSPANKKSGEDERMLKNLQENVDSKAHHRKTPNNKNQRYNNKLPEIKFEEYISHEKCSEGLKRGELLSGSIRINPKDFKDAYITSPVAGERDIYIDGLVSRNRALQGDMVAVKILPRDQWKTVLVSTGKPKATVEEANSTSTETSKVSEVEEPTYSVKTGKVVYLIEKKHPRVGTGHLSIYRNNAFGFALLSPIDNRLPRLMIPLNECPENFKQRPKDFDTTLFVVYITGWNCNMAFATGKLMRSLGEAGHIAPETEAILINNNIDSAPFNQDVIDCLPNGKAWKISKEEIDKRRDLRSECIFTIDPPTARDLDDALSCEQISDDVYQVGVHIADVSYFIDQGNALDKEASSRATSVYLAQKVVPMLPSILCEQLCSLNPGVERLAYSVIWKLKSDGTILEEWFGRTVIKSCVKLSYNHAQQLIVNENVADLTPDDYPAIDGAFSLPKICQTVKMLYGISKYLRDNRFKSGALRLDQPKLSFSLDGPSGLPNGCTIYEYKDSNRMIEEFMLLANMAVARKIYKHEPERAILRCHPPPHAIMMEDLENLCKHYGILFDITDSTSISNSLSKIQELEPEIQSTLLPAITLLCTKPFQNAKYFCTGSMEDEEAYRHYALNVPLYTHFTSPIRRYPDVLVHRFLTSALKDDYKVQGKIEELQLVADHCNDKKSAAKKASEQSSELFFNVYVMECGPITEKGVIVGILDKAIDVLCTRLGVVKRVYCDKLSLYTHKFQMEALKPRLTLYWQDEAKLKDLSVDDKLELLTKKFESKWAMQKNQHNDEDTEIEIPDDAKEQILTLFTPVNVVLAVERNAPTKMKVILKSPFDDESTELGL